MDFCDECQSAGSVNRYGFCEICGTVHETAEPIQLRTVEPFEHTKAAKMAEVSDSATAYEAAGSRREAVG